MTHSTIAASDREQRRRAAAWRWLLLALCGVLLVGCGGSGSSGFDIAAAENAAIDEALAGGTCVVEQGLSICASGAVETPASPTPTATPPTNEPGATATRTPSGRPSATPTATVAPAQPAVDVALDPADVAACASADAAQACTVRLVFVPMAVPGGAAYRAAVRPRDPNGPWRIMTVTDNQVQITVPPEVVTLQTAILVYASDPGPVPAELAVLSESGADFAFVTPPFAVRGDSAGGT